MPPVRAPLRREIRKDRRSIALTVPGPVPDQGSHGDNMLSFITKQENAAPKSQQIQDPFLELSTMGKIINPLMPPERLLVLAEENAVHAACLQAKAKDAVGRGWNLVSKDGKPHERQTVKLADRLEKMCPELTFSELLFQAAWEQAMIGLAAWEISRDTDNNIDGIFAVPAHTLRATKTEHVWVQVRGMKTRYFSEFGSGITVNTEDGDPTGDENAANELLIFKTYTPRSPFYGVPEWVSAIPAIAELTAIREYNVSFFASNGMSDRIIHVTADSLDHAQVTATTVHKGLKETRGRGHTSIVTYGTPNSKVQIAFLQQANRREGHFLQRREDLVKEVLMAHQVPPYRIGWALLGSLGGSAAQEMLRSYRMGAIEPLQTVIEDRLAKTLFNPDVGGINIGRQRWALNDISWEETELNLEIATKSVQYGIYTPNEARELIGKERTDDEAMDEHYMNTAIAPITGQQAEADAAAQNGTNGNGNGTHDDVANTVPLDTFQSPHAGGGTNGAVAPPPTNGSLPPSGTNRRGRFKRPKPGSKLPGSGTANALGSFTGDNKN